MAKPSKEKARTTAATVERTEKVTETNALHESNCTTEQDTMQVSIADYLPHGENNAITTKRLLEMTGYPDTRALTKAIEAERLAGVPILSRCSDGGGYFLPLEGDAGIEERKRFIRSLIARATSIFKIVRALQRANNE